MAGADARYVLHNSTLDGGFLRPRCALRLSGRLDSFRISYNYVMRGAEFTPPPLRDGKHNYHSLAIAWEPR